MFHNTGEVIAKCRRLVGMFKHSEALNRALRDTQLRLKSTHKQKLVRDVSTRWNSTYKMLNSLIINFNALSSIALEVKHASIKKHMPDATEMVLIRQFCMLLQPLYEMTNLFGGHKYVSISIIYPILYKQVNLLEFALIQSNDTIKYITITIFFNKISRIARIILSMPVTSVPVECLFSQVGLTQTDLRNRLSPDLLESLTLIKNHLQYFAIFSYFAAANFIQHTIYYIILTVFQKSSVQFR